MTLTITRSSLRRSALALLVIGVAVTAFACGENQAEPTQIPMGIEFDKRSATIDGIMEGQDVSQTFLLINRGEQAAIVKNITVLDASECDQVVVPESSFIVPPGDVIPVSVLMKGHRATESPHTVTLGVQTKAGGATQTKLAINIQGVAAAPEAPSGPRLGVDHKSVDIGKIPYDWPLHEQFTLFNYGDQPLRFDGVPLVRILEGC